MAKVGYIEKNGNIGEFVRKTQEEYLRGSVTISEYVTFDMYDTINKIEAYLNSKHTTGDTDSLEREKPFFNIVVAASNIWFRATDIDRKDIRIKATKAKDTLDAFLATIHIQDWMRRENFGQFLNEWGRVLARYGSASLKFIEQDGRLIPSVSSWNRMIVDQIDYTNNPKIEVMELTEAQLKKRKGYDKDVVKSLCDARKARTLLKGRRKDNKSEYIKLYEVHGEMPLSWKTQKESDEEEYVQIMFVISFEATDKKDIFDDYILYAGREAKEPNMITHLIKEDGRTLSIGSVEHLFEAQWMENHNKKAIKDQLDIASKLIFQTADGSFVGQNALSAVENGDILIHKVNQPLTQVQNNSHDVSALQAFGQEWKALANEIAGISESMLGATAPSGTAWRQVETLLNESHSLFELMTENKGLYIKQMFAEYIIPFIKKKLNHSKEIAATLELNDINQIDSVYIKNQSVMRANNDIKNMILKGGMVTPQQQKQLMQSHGQDVQASLAKQGDQRFFKPSEIKDKTWKEQFKDLEWELEIDVTGEGTPDKEDLATLNTVLSTIASNPRVLSDPNAKLVFNKILGIAGGVSPLQLVDSQPYLGLPSKRFVETLDYVDAPEDIKRQMEAQQGFQPSQMSNSTPPQPTAPIGTGGSMPPNGNITK